MTYCRQISFRLRGSKPSFLKEAAIMSQCRKHTSPLGHSNMLKWMPDPEMNRHFTPFICSILIKKIYCFMGEKYEAFLGMDRKLWGKYRTLRPQVEFVAQLSLTWWCLPELYFRCQSIISKSSVKVWNIWILFLEYVILELWGFRSRKQKWQTVLFHYLLFFILRACCCHLIGCLIMVKRNSLYVLA